MRLLTIDGEPTFSLARSEIFGRWMMGARAGHRWLWHNADWRFFIQLARSAKEAGHTISIRRLQR